MNVRALAGLLLLAGCAAPARDSDRPVEIICCGADEVAILEITAPGKIRKVWAWKAPGTPELPADLRPAFRSTDDCKPVVNGRILVTSSSGGVALVERASGRALFWARVQNAHSAELLPGDRLVVAGSYGERGNRLVLFSLDHPGREIFSTPLHGAHGVVWDPRRERLWALGDGDLKAYRLSVRNPEQPALIEAASHALPTPGGHDLRAVPGTPNLVVTTNTDVYLFDRRTGTFGAFPGLSGKKKVKSVDIHPRTGRILFTQADESWWTHTIRFLEPAGTIAGPGEKTYKARWNP